MATLVIGRKPGQKVYIGEDVAVSIRISRGRLLLVIEAPPHVEVRREEPGDGERPTAGDLTVKAFAGE